MEKAHGIKHFLFKLWYMDSYITVSETWKQIEDARWLEQTDEGILYFSFHYWWWNILRKIKISRYILSISWLFCLFLIQHCLWRLFISPVYSIKIESHIMVMTVENITVILHICTVSHTGLMTSISDRAGICEICQWVGLLCIMWVQIYVFIAHHYTHGFGKCKCVMWHLQCCAVLHHNHPLRHCRHCILILWYNFASLSFRNSDTGCYFLKNTCALLGRWWRYQYLHDAVFWAMGAALMKSNFWVCIITPGSCIK